MTGDNGDGFPGGDRMGLSVDDTYQTQESRFDLQEETSAQDKSLEQLTTEQNEMKRTRRRNKRDNLKGEGATEAEALKSTMQDLSGERNKGIHNVLQQTKFYDNMLGNYQAELSNLPVGTRVLNKVTSVVGYRLDSIRTIEDKIDIVGRASETVYSPEMKGIVEESARYFLTESRQNVKNAGDLMRKISTEREKITENLEDLTYKAQDRADYVVALKEKVGEYSQGINQTNKKITEIKRTHGQDLPTEAREALKYNQKILDQYKSNKAEALSSVRDCEDDLSGYHTDIQALTIESKKAEAVEAKFMAVYNGVRANLTQAESFMNSDQSNVGYIKAFEIMESLASINEGVRVLMDPLNTYFKDSFDTINEIPVEQIDPVIDNAISVAAQSGKEMKNDLVEMYRSQEPV